VEQTFRYPFPSEVVKTCDKQTLRLATFCLGEEEHPFFFEGELRDAKKTADLLRALMTVVRSRFHIPAAMLQRILAESDPVVTANDDRLRFEGFSACCGAYARLDLLEHSFAGKVRGRGTTNVDFNQPMLAALSRIRIKDKVGLAVGADKVVLKQRDGDVVEKKVALPIRWMKGFVEVQVVQSRMEQMHRIEGIQAHRFLRSLPRVKTNRRASYIVAAGNSLRLSQLEAVDGVRVGGLERLTVLEGLARKAMSLDVYRDPLTDASGWVLTFDDCRFTLVISPEVWRGFSGEGQALSAVARRSPEALATVRAQLRWQSIVEPDRLAKATKWSAKHIDSALSTLGTRGLVGYDLSEQAWFHREMPFDVSEVEKLQPRLIAARKLIDGGKVKIERQTKAEAEVYVESREIRHRVVIGIQDGATKCTCPWFNKHGRTRGPCKHILASQIVLEEQQ
ncbi:MAG: SWIM zinc finger family protein, partial [Planctomycetota bacterium]